VTDFDRSLAFTLAWERGFDPKNPRGNVDNPKDRGGRTSRGITQKTYDGACAEYGWPTGVDVWGAPDTHVTTIYHKRFWLRSGCDTLPWPLCLAVFDTAVLHGITFAVTRLQAVVGADADGVFGVKTLAKVQRFNPYGAAEAFLQRRDDRYEELISRDPTQKVFYGGWEKRCDALCDAALVPRTADREAR